MHTGTIPVLTISVIAAGEVAASRFVTFGNVQAGADAAISGVSAAAASAGDALALTLLGVVDMVAGAAIAAGDRVISDANGQPVPIGGGANPGGRALNAAGIGERVSILLR